MSSANLGWMFYKDYFNELDYEDISSEENSTILKDKVNELIKKSINIPENEPQGNLNFKATTTYPGLLFGSGTTHELPSIEGQAILGFYFDYTTGLPIIPSSSVKGILRSAFKHPEYIQELLKDEGITFELEDIKKLELEIFGQDNGSSKVLQGKDIFFDATIISAEVGGKILGDDYITPHKNREKKTDEDGNLLPDEIFNPIPLRFIKVLPNVTFRFDFELQDYNDVVTKEKKLFLFAQILQDLGIGAKTNVGYGKFKDILSQLRKDFVDENSPVNKCIVFIQNSKKASHDLRKKLKSVIDENQELDKNKILEIFNSKYPDESEVANKIRRLLK